MKRIVSALILACVVFAAVWYLPQHFFRFVVLTVVAVSAFEFSRLFLTDAIERVASLVATTTVAMVMLSTPHEGLPVLATLIGALFFLSLVFLLRANEFSLSVPRLGLSIFSLLYLGVSLGFWGWLKSIPDGNHWLIMALVPAILGDTVALVTGRLVGRHRFAPRASPKKTWEGFVGSGVGSALGTFLVASLFFPSVLAWQDALGLTICFWILVPCGDLIESMLKRAVGVKDAGSLIPGHGGLLDRLDALIFVAPFIYFYAVHS